MTWLAAKHLIDVQITLEHLDAVNEWPDESLPGPFRRRGNTTDYVPAGTPAEPAEWTKRYWSDR